MTRVEAMSDKEKTCWLQEIVELLLKHSAEQDVEEDEQVDVLSGLFCTQVG